MKKLILCIFLISFVYLLSPVFAADETQSSNASPAAAETHPGKLIRETDVNGYHLSYDLIDLQAQMNDASGMQHDMQHMGTHHLMLYIRDAGGKSIVNAQAGFLIVNPDGSEQKIMAMQMGDAYGANINMPTPGDYTIKSKAVFDDKKLLDSFTYKVGPR